MSLWRGGRGAGPVHLGPGATMAPRFPREVRAMLSPTHIVLLALLILLALVVFGPKRLPELGASVGRAIQEFRKASASAASEFRSVADIGPVGPVVPTAPS